MEPHWGSQKDDTQSRDTCVEYVKTTTTKTTTKKPTINHTMYLEAIYATVKGVRLSAIPIGPVKYVGYANSTTVHTGP